MGCCFNDCVSKKYGVKHHILKSIDGKLRLFILLTFNMLCFTKPGWVSKFSEKFCIKWTAFFCRTYSLRRLVLVVMPHTNKQLRNFDFIKA